MQLYNIKDLIGQTIIRIDKTDYEISFTTKEGKDYLIYHEQDCCEEVYIKDICGKIKDLVDAPLLMAEEITDNNDDHEWTFYKFATIKGYVTIQWYGDPDSYYSTKVNLVCLDEN